MRDEILDLLRDKKGSFVSGQEMSDRCHVTRTAIWKHIKALRDRGYQIDSFTRKGYKLVKEPDLLNALEVEPLLVGCDFGLPYVYMDSTASTNVEARELAQRGAEEGMLVVAEEQTAGKGRLARGWYSPYGKGIWMTIVLRPTFAPAEAPKCTLMAAVALVKAFHEMGLTKASIKWPNDILVGKKKLVGILTEMAGSMESIDYIIIGMGINTHNELEDWPDDLKEIGTSFLQEGLSIRRKDLLASCIKHLEAQYASVIKEGFQKTLDEWRKYSNTLGQEVTVKAPGNMHYGFAMDIDEDGNLLVKTEDGHIERIVAGDVSIRNRY